MKRTSNLYDVPLKPLENGLNPMEDDQLNYSREKRERFYVINYVKFVSLSVTQ